VLLKKSMARAHAGMLVVLVAMFMMPIGSESILVWNIRGFNVQLHMDMVHELVTVERPSLV
jgi:hypothetical protein